MISELRSRFIQRFSLGASDAVSLRERRCISFFNRATLRAGPCGTNRSARARPHYWWLYGSFPFDKLRVGSLEKCHFGTTHHSEIFRDPSGFRRYHKKSRCGKERYMPNNYENRVLVRTNARQLSAEEFQWIMEKGNAQMTQLPSTPF